MDYLLFDQSAIATLIGKSVLQSIEYQQGMHLVNHICRRGQPEIFEDVLVEYLDNGIIFSGLKSENSKAEHHLFCIDLKQCNIMVDKTDMAAMLTIIQKCLRTTLKIWNRQPFSSSERINGSKSIIFPFMMSDHRRIVIERANNLPRLTKRMVDQPLLAYKYTDSDPHGEDDVNTTILGKACEAYLDCYIDMQNKLKKAFASHVQSSNQLALKQIESTSLYKSKEDFIYWGYEAQYRNLTITQKNVVDYPDFTSPLRVEGAAGTGKTLSLVMRAYKILMEKKSANCPYRLIFFTHSEETCKHSRQIFESYECGSLFLSKQAPQSIVFISLFSFCTKFARIPETALLEMDAGDSKTYQLMVIDSVLEKAAQDNTISTYIPLLTDEFKKLFCAETPRNTLCSLLQHEFSIQIKGRTDCTFENYLELPSIKNGLPCKNPEEKQLVFTLFNAYQTELNSMNNYDVDDVTLEALSRLNAPVWRRERKESGYDYILVDEMHLFSLNEQTVFHFLTKDATKKIIPICFALDYSQAIGDRGDIERDYIATAFSHAEEKRYNTVFRNSPQIATFCAGIAASGALMFQGSFKNPYGKEQYVCSESNAQKFGTPVLYMCKDDSEILDKLSECLDSCKKTLQCKNREIGIISFVPQWVTEEGVQNIQNRISKPLMLFDNQSSITEDDYIVLSPYSASGMEFKAVVLLGVDEGRIPQTSGTSDISQNFTRYAAYNLLYLTASRAKWGLILLSSKVNGRSSCLDHVIEAGYLECNE